MSTKNVIDVSQFNGTIAWERVQVDAAIIRLGYRGYGKAGTLVTDAQFSRNVSGAAKAGIPIGVYWLSQAISTKEAEEEAQYVVKKLQGLKITYPVYLDSEYSNNRHNGRADGLSKAKRTDYALAWLAAIQKAGFTPGIYASESWFKDMLELRRLTGYTLWVAKYSSKPPDLGVQYDAWQYTSSGTMAGLPGAVDRSWFYRDFAEQRKTNPTEKESEEEDVVRYEKLKDIPNNNGFRDIIEKLMDAGILGGDGSDKTGNEDVIDLSHDMVRNLVLEYRGGAFDRKFLAVGMEPAVKD